jgi:hypothetical protein
VCLLFTTAARAEAPLAPAFSTSALAAAAVPPGFDETVVWSGLSNPTAVRFAADGRVFVAEQPGDPVGQQLQGDQRPATAPTPGAYEFLAARRAVATPA